jgi:hypothetical protein
MGSNVYLHILSNSWRHYKFPRPFSLDLLHLHQGLISQVSGTHHMSNKGGKKPIFYPAWILNLCVVLGRGVRLMRDE